MFLSLCIWLWPSDLLFRPPLLLLRRVRMAWGGGEIDGLFPFPQGSSVQFSSVQSLTLCDPMNRSMPGLPVHHQLPEVTQTHVHRVSEAIQPLHRYKNLSKPNRGANESACQCRRCKRHRFDPWIEKTPWSRKWQPIPVFLPGKFHEQRSMVGCSPWGHKDSDTTGMHATETLKWNYTMGVDL